MEDKYKFIAEAKANRRDNIEPFMLEVLASMLKHDLKYFNAHYIQERSQEIIEKTLAKLKYNNETILKARKAFLDVLLDGAKEQMYGFQDDYDAAKKNLKIKSEKDKAKEVLRKIERLRDKLPQDATEHRSMSCEPVCQEIASKILSKEFIMKDEAFIDSCIEMDNELLIGTICRPLLDELFVQLLASLDNNYKKANEAYWGCSRENIKLSQIDRRTKK